MRAAPRPAGSSPTLSRGGAIEAAGATAAVRFRLAAAGRAAALRLGAAFLAVERRAVERLAGRLAAFFRVVERRAVVLRVAFRAAGFLAVDFLVDLLVEDFFFAAMLGPPDSAIIATMFGRMKAEFPCVL